MQEKIVRFHKNCFMVALVSLLGISIHSISAGCIERLSRLENDRGNTSFIRHPGKYVSEVNCKKNEAIKLLTNNSKFRFGNIRKASLKALVVMLALQSSDFFSLPRAEALSVFDLDQNVTYEPNGPSVVLLPMKVMTSRSTEDRYNTAMVLSDIAAGTLISNGTNSRGITPPQTFENGTWNTTCSPEELEFLLSKFIFTPALGYNESLELRTKIRSPVSSFVLNGVMHIRPQERGTIQIMATGGGITTTQAPRINATMTTIGTNAIVTTTTRSSSVVSTTVSRTQLVVPPTKLAPTDESSNTLSNPQDSTDSTVSSLVSSAPSTSVSQTIALTPASKTKILSSTETSQIPLVVPADQPPYAVIGGSVAGGVALLGCIAAVLAAKCGFLCGAAQKSAKGNVQDPEKALSNQYGRVELALINENDRVGLPPARPDNTYGKVVAADLLPESPYDSPQKPMQGFSQYGPGPVEKSPYENVDAPLN